MSRATQDDREPDLQDDSEGGAVSEVANLGEGEPISPDQSVAAAPGSEDEGVQEGRQGPNAVTGSETQQQDGGE